MGDMLTVIVITVALFAFIMWASTKGYRGVRSFSCPNEKFTSDDGEFEVVEWAPRLPTQAEYNAMAMAEAKLKIDMEKLLGK